jgi:transposase
MGRSKNKNYTEEFKQSSAKLAATSDQPVSQTAKELGVNENTLHGWISKYHPKSNTNKTSENELEAELKRLRKDNIRLKQERDILKKAAAYFANETL